jgi:hypothetical protein
VGGRAVKQNGYVALEVDGVEVERVSGEKENRMRLVRWNVHEYRGATARIIVADESSDGWSHINADGFCHAD